MKKMILFLVFFVGLIFSSLALFANELSTLEVLLLQKNRIAGDLELIEILDKTNGNPQIQKHGASLKKLESDLKNNAPALASFDDLLSLSIANRWKLVTGKVKDIIGPCKTPLYEDCFLKIQETKKYVLDKKLDPKKTEDFFFQVDICQKAILPFSYMTAAFQKEFDSRVLAINDMVVTSSVVSSPVGEPYVQKSNLGNMAAIGGLKIILISGFVFFIFLGFFFLLRRKKTSSQVVFCWELDLTDKKDQVLWESIKVHLMRLFANYPHKIFLNSVNYCSTEEELYIEIEISPAGLSLNDILNLKNELAGKLHVEFSLAHTYEKNGSIRTSKLVIALEK